MKHIWNVLQSLKKLFNYYIIIRLKNGRMFVFKWKKGWNGFFYTLYHKTNGWGDKSNIKHVYGYGIHLQYLQFNIKNKDRIIFWIMKWSNTVGRDQSPKDIIKDLITPECIWLPYKVNRIIPYYYIYIISTIVHLSYWHCYIIFIFIVMQTPFVSHSASFSSIMKCIWQTLTLQIWFVVL